MVVTNSYTPPKQIDWGQNGAPILLIATAMITPVILKAKDSFTHTKK